MMWFFITYIAEKIMKFDPIKKELFTENGEFIKKMNCPYKVNWDNLEKSNSLSRRCLNCDQQIVDTEHLSDDALLIMMRENPNTCLKINLNQNNIKVITSGFVEKK